MIFAKTMKLLLLVLGLCSVIEAQSPQQPSSTTLPPSSTTLPPSSTTLPPSSTTLPPSSTLVITTKEEAAQEEGPTGPLKKPYSRSLSVNSTIISRYSTTVISSRTVNPENQAQEATFLVTLPESAFISNFSMIIREKEYVARVEKKEDAKEIYDAAVAQGQTAAHVEARDSNNFAVSVNIGPNEKVDFRLKYEELLQRRRSFYEQEININPGQEVDTLTVDVYINEANNISSINVPEIRNEVELRENEQANSVATIDYTSGNSAHISYHPTPDQLRRDFKSGVAGQFVVEYDVERDDVGGELQVVDGYFVHFFAPDLTTAMNKHVVFVIDTSGSMSGRKIEQTREALNSILSDLKPDDLFSLIEFDSEIKVWNGESVENIIDDNHFFNPPPRPRPLPRPRPPLPLPPGLPPSPPSSLPSLPVSGSTQSSVPAVSAISVGPSKPGSSSLPSTASTTISSPTPPSSTTTEVPTTTTTERIVPRKAIRATADNVRLAKQFVDSLHASGGTNINDALLEGLRHAQESVNKVNMVPLIVFLTDGEPTVGESAPDAIIKNIKEANAEFNVPIYSLAFGTGADFEFLKKLSLQNTGFARRIYEASDATLQLRKFFEEILTPLLSDITVTYLEDSVENGTVSKSNSRSFFKGSEFVLTGKLVSPDITDFQVRVQAATATGPIDLTVLRSPKHPSIPDLFPPRPPIDHLPPIDPKPEQPRGVFSLFLERLWAFRTVSDLLDQVVATDDKSEKDELNEKAVNISLKYNFVTDVTSLVVVKPNSTQEGTLTESKPQLESSSFSSGGTNRIQAHHGVALFSLPAASPPRPAHKARPAPPRRRPAVQPYPGYHNHPGSAVQARPIFPTTTTFRFTSSSTDVSATTTTAAPSLINWSNVTVEVDGTFLLPNGTYAQLGLDENELPIWDDCDTMTVTGGTCRYIQFCTDVPDYTTNFELFMQNSCAVTSPQGEYVGVCCPPDEVSTVSTSPTSISP